MARSPIMLAVALACAWSARAQPPHHLPALTLTLAEGVTCPTPATESALLRVPVGCVAPWDGYLYTDAEHMRTRQGASRSARLVAELRSERDRAYAAHDALSMTVLPRLDILAARLDSLADVPESLAGLHRAMPPPDDDWPAGVYVATGVTGALAAGLGCAAGLDGEGWAVGCSAGGVVAAAAATWAVERLVGWLR